MIQCIIQLLSGQHTQDSQAEKHRHTPGEPRKRQRRLWWQIELFCDQKGAFLLPCLQLYLVTLFFHTAHVGGSCWLCVFMWVQTCEYVKPATTLRPTCIWYQSVVRSHSAPVALNHSSHLLLIHFNSDWQVYILLESCSQTTTVYLVIQSSCWLINQSVRWKKLSGREEERGGG